MRLLAVLCACASACAPRFDWPEFRLPQNAVSEAQSRVNAHVLDATDTLTYSVNGDRVSAVLTRYRRMQIHTQEGVRAGEVHLPFSSRMKLVQFDGRNFRPDAALQQRAIKAKLEEVTVKRPLGDVGVKDVGELVMSIPDVAPGSIIDWFAVYQIPDALLIEPLMMRDRYQCDRAELLIVAPKDADFELRFLESGVSKPVAPVPAVAPSKDQLAFRFVLRDLPALIPEEMMPAPARTGPAIWPVFRGMRNGRGPRNERWEDVLAWVKRNHRLAAPGRETDPEKLQAAFAEEAVRLLLTETFLHVGERPFGTGDDRIAAGLRLHDALARRGFAVGLGLVARESAALVLPEVPSPALFDAAVAAVQVAGKTLYLDPACATCPLDQVSQALEGAQVVALFDEGARVETLPVRDAKDNGYSVSLTMKLGVKGDLSGSGQAVMSGAPAAKVRTAFAKQETASFARELSLLPTAALSKLSAADPTHAGMTFDASFELNTRCKEEAPAKMRCGLDLFVDELMPEVWRESRTRDLLMPGVFQHTLAITIEIPVKARIETPPPMLIKSKFGEYSLTFLADAGQLAVTRRFVISARKVAAEDYDELWQFLSQARQFDRVSPLIELFPEEPQAPAPEPKKSEKPKKGKKK